MIVLSFLRFVYWWEKKLPGNLFYSRVIREHLEGVGLVVVGGHSGDEAAQAAELGEEVILSGEGVVPCGEGAANGETVEGVLQAGVVGEVALPVEPYETLQVGYALEAVLAEVGAHGVLFMGR